ncbi:MerR family transcriptional regulator [Brevibacillus choshinensis]|uniref:MerR family transcriptional regulator n=1 Tax=Brevibacillus choshinensis TaxID=54911 RepID=UPI002E249299|nr:MerR family transcriptional regulator [Brevibacillus choshinensis]MED4582707.1 MerR family transcriptional regulator [Brevibacillus choshinensis]MED4750719.1 MerR family transcriptional regulator [Brevibacillus choshinensis]MED4779819.1 MerR family transcriptional regulator [Brevibacillus choshinensis]
MFLIGEISKLFQIDIRTLRYYDDIELFKPAHVNDRSGYRYYSIEQFEQLNTILYLKALNIPLKNVKLFLENRDIDRILQLLEEQQQETEKRIQEFTQIQKKITSRIHQIVDATNEQELGKIREVELPERTIVWLKQKIQKTDNLEMSIRLLENRTNMKSTIFLGKVGLSISLENVRQRNFESYDSLFVIVENESFRISEGNEKILPRDKYVTIRFAGTHADASPYYEKLMDYVDEKGYEIVADATEITLIDYGLTHDPTKFVTEIQLLAK